MVARHSLPLLWLSSCLKFVFGPLLVKVYNSASRSVQVSHPSKMNFGDSWSHVQFATIQARNRGTVPPHKSNLVFNKWYTDDFANFATARGTCRFNGNCAPNSLQLLCF